MAVARCGLRHQMEAGLEVGPEPVAGAEVAREPQRGVCRDSALAVDDLVDPAGWDADGDGEPVLGDLKGP